MEKGSVREILTKGKKAIDMAVLRVSVPVVDILDRVSRPALAASTYCWGLGLLIGGAMSGDVGQELMGLAGIATVVINEGYSSRDNSTPVIVIRRRG